jgi:hypothetical protein
VSHARSCGVAALGGAEVRKICIAGCEATSVASAMVSGKPGKLMSRARSCGVAALGGAEVRKIRGV